MKRVIEKKLIIYGMTLLFFLTVAVSGVSAAEQDFTIIFNGQQFQADAYMKDGVTMIAAESLQKIPGLEVREAGYVPLRQFFEGLGGVVSWDGAERAINVSWREVMDGYSANQLVVVSQEKMKEFNTYKLTGNSVVEMKTIGVGNEAISAMPAIPSFNIKQSGVFQQEPLTMHMIQTMEMPFAEMGLSEEELALFDGNGGMVTEMVWADNAIYQKTPFIDQWIVQDLGELGMTALIEQFSQMNPQQSLDMMAQYGLFYTFGENQVIDGQEYYVVNTFIDGEVYKKLMSDLLGDGFFPEMPKGGSELTLEEQEEFDQQMAQAMTAIQAMLAGMEMEYSLQSLINKKSLTSDYMYFDMMMTFTIEDPAVGPVSVSTKASGEFLLSDYGVAIELPDLSGAITQLEYMELLGQGMEPQIEVIR